MLTMSRLITTTAFTVVLLGGSVTVPAFAQDAAPSSRVAQKMETRVETRIKTLHDELKITPDQEQQWSAVAQTMRDNEETLIPLYEARKNVSSMTAMDNLKNHQSLSQAYADAFGKFIAAFEPLYDSMSDEQKKWADDSFRKEDARMHKIMKAAKIKTKTSSAQ